ncbi:MAG TPA: helix-turn-helix domain-containing protein [Casimicrobiaceae bacterium]|jgi:AcrR family transcriptional regulator|nr:helix-turn-helix domain-containing protein [Casimicrobiaceae bacterium]
MPGPVRETKRRIIDAAYGLFYKGGFARVGVDDIAEAAGVTKRTLYYHFDSKDALVAAVLEVQNALMLTRIQRWARHASGNPATVVEKLFAEFSAWAKQPGWRGSGFTRAAMEFAHLPGHPARVAARRHKAAVESWLADELGGNRAARQLARQIMLLIEGCHSLILIHGDAGYADAAAEAARVLVERHTSRRRR